MIIDCLTIAKSFDDEVRAAVAALREKGVRPRLGELLATSTQSAVSYSNTKRKKAETLGIDYEAVRFEPDVRMEQLLAKISEWNSDERIHGLLIGMPTYPNIEAEKLISAISPHKDVDGLAPFNSYAVYSNQEHLGIVPATAIAAVHILETITVIRGKRVAVIGRGRTVGRPVAAMLVNRSAIVTVCHSATPVATLEQTIRQSDIIVAATGSAGILKSEWFQPEQIVIDCGISFRDGKTVGDVNAEEISSVGVFVTPVPKGVGAVTNSIIFGNVIKAVNLRNQPL
jgi:methylenetetrahydrofolate dehydrogenase (NADP+)/methenyltetrahydrofolate cyclohydrolase